MKKINLYSTYEFLIEVDSQNFMLNSLNFVELTNINQNSILVKAYPLNQSKHSLPFCINLNYQNGNLFCNNFNIQIFNLKDRYDVFISPFLISATICLYNKTHTIKNVRHTISAYEDRVKISNKCGEFVYEVNSNSFSSQVYNNYILILCKSNNIKSLLVFNTQNNTFFEICGNQIEITDSTITCLKKLNNTFNHVIVQTYKLDQIPNLEKEELFEDAPQNAVCPKLIPYKFFEAIKIKNLTLARTFLSENLNKFGQE